MEIISCAWAVHKLDLHLTSQICQFERVLRFLFLLLKKFPWLLPLAPLPFPTGRDFPHCGLESEKGCFIFSGDLWSLQEKARGLAPVALQDDLGVKRSYDSSTDCACVLAMSL